MKTSKILQIALAVVIVVLIVLLYNSIMKPVRFDNEYILRRDAVVVKLKEIRNLQETYKMTYGRYAGDIDSLVLGLKEGKLPVVKKYGNVPDEMTEAEALKKGIIFPQKYNNRCTCRVYISKYDLYIVFVIY